MLTAKIVLCISAFVFFLIARITVDYEEGLTALRSGYKRKNMSKTEKIVVIIFLGLGVVSAIALCVLLLMTWTAFTIGWIFVIITISVYILFKERGIECNSAGILLVVTVLAFIIGVVIYYRNIKAAEPEISTVTTKIDIVCANDNTTINGSINGIGLFVYYVHGSVEQSDMYKYYYCTDDGGFKMTSIPADDTTIYYLKDGEKQPYILDHTITTITKTYNHNVTPSKLFKEETTSVHQYEIHVPEGSIVSYFEFDAK